MLDEVGRIWPGMETAKVYMLGFADIGQFALRMAYLSSETFENVSIGALGQVTLLDKSQKWPTGIMGRRSVARAKI
jgi:hypothetical protein